MKLAILVVFALAAVVAAENWAVLIAGSNGYGNYRHQADICHAFQILTRNGVKKENIITFMYDDIANYRSNPYPGKVFNKPTPAGTPGVDVYAGVNKDYTGADTTAKNLIAVLQGEESKVPAGHKVLKSGPNDNIFIFYSDHGSPGLVAMPTGGYLYATDLIAALKVMNTKRMYKKLVFYLEACESGSMFDKILPTDLNVFATTAANPSESSWGWYCSPEDTIDGKRIGSCLGDEYSVKWMEDSDLGKEETLQQQFEAVRTAVVKSHVMQYGDMRFNTDSIWQFQGAANKTHAAKVATAEHKGTYGVNSRDNTLHFLYHQYVHEPTAQHAQELEAEIASRQKADSFFSTLARTVFGNEHQRVLRAAPKTICDDKCCRPVVDYMHEHCGGFTDYSMKYIASIVNMCEQGGDAEYMLTAVKDMCVA